MSAPRERVIVLALALMLLATSAHGVTHLRRGDAAPTLALKDLRGADVDTAKFRGGTVVLIFGEPYHEKTRQACALLQAGLRDSRLEGEPVAALLVCAQPVKPEDERAAAPATIVRDGDRRAFGQYQVAVMPSVVVIDKDGRVVHALAGMTPRFGDVLLDSLLFASGRLSAAQYDAALNPAPATGPAAADLRAERASQLARQLARRGLDDLAAEKFAEALTLDPDHVPAHLELGMLMLKRQRLPDAEQHFRAVLARQPASMQASLGLAFVQAQRGGAELDLAERTVRDLLARNPSLPRAHYLLGLIDEQRGKPQDAAADYKRAAQLLLERADEE
jgi:tetratricopeptide (TPR) repeat protein